MFGSRVESGLELRLPELGRHQALGIETGRDQHGGHLLLSRFPIVSLDHRKGLLIL